MGFLYSVGKKIKGETQQAKGNYDLRTGHTIRGVARKLKGKANETIANADLRARSRRRRTY